MSQIIICAALFVFSLSILCFQVVFRKKNQLSVRLKKVVATAGQIKKQEEDILSKPFSERVIRPLITWLSAMISRFTPSAGRHKLQQSLQLAGNPGNFKAHEYQTIQLLFVIISMLTVWLLTWLGGKNLPEQVMLLALTAIVAMLLGKAYLNTRIRKRKKALIVQLPDALDLLTVSVEAGLGFDAALLHLVEKHKGALADEFRITLKELQVGKPRREALRDLGKRTDTEDILTFVGTMIQADQLGVPITNILRTQAEQVRSKRRQRVQERAMKAPIKMLIPLVFFIFPSIYIVLLGPAAIKIVKIFMNGF